MRKDVRRKKLMLDSARSPLDTPGIISDMARECHVHKSTVSRLMNGISRASVRLLPGILAYCRKHRIPLYYRDFIADGRTPREILMERGRYNEQQH